MIRMILFEIVGQIKFIRVKNDSTELKSKYSRFSVCYFVKFHTKIQQSIF